MSIFVQAPKTGRAVIRRGLQTHSLAKVPPLSPKPAGPQSSLPAGRTQTHSDTRHHAPAAVKPKPKPKPKPDLLDFDDENSDKYDESLNGDLEEQNMDKWGWVVYRCTHDDDWAWERFKEMLQQQARDGEARSGVTELWKKLSLKFVVNKYDLDGASQPKVLRRFWKWASAAIEVENPRLKTDKLKHNRSIKPRYAYFIYVDEASLRSFMYRDFRTGEAGWKGGYINLVAAYGNRQSDD